MKLKETLQKAARTTRFFHRRAYRSLGLWHLHRQIDVSLALMLLLCFISFPILMKCSFKKLPEETEVLEVVPEEELNSITETEEVHEDLGDAPVEKEIHVSLSELEKRVQLGELSMENRSLQKGESLLTVLNKEKVPANERMNIVESLELLINLKSLKPGMEIILFKDNDELVGLSMTLKEGESISVLKEIDGSWTPFSHTGRVETKTTR